MGGKQTDPSVSIQLTLAASEEREGRHSKNEPSDIFAEVWANQWVVQGLLVANQSLPQPSSQWHSVPSPWVRPQLPGPLLLHRGCTGQGAIWLGFLVSWAWPTGTLARASSRTAITSVCKRQTLSERAPTLLPPMLGVNLPRPRNTLGLQERGKRQNRPLKQSWDVISSNSQRPRMTEPLSPFHQGRLSASAR